MTNVVRLAPETSATIIPENEVSVQRLASLLEAAVIEHAIDPDNDIYASEGLEFPVWIGVDQERRLITFLTYADCEDGQSLLERANEMNQSIVAVQFCADAKRLWGQYYLTFDGGANARQFIKMLRRFAGAFKAGMNLGASTSNNGSTVTQAATA